MQLKSLRLCRMMDLQTPGLRVNSNLLRAYWVDSGRSPSSSPLVNRATRDFQAAAGHFMPPLELVLVVAMKINPRVVFFLTCQQKDQ